VALQVNVGTVYVTNGSPTVRHQYRLFLSGVTGGFLVGDTVSVGGKVGIAGAWNSVTGELKWSRVIGTVLPAVGEAVSGPNGSGTVSSLGAGSPPGWDLSVALPAVASFSGHHATYDVLSRTTDTFVLTTTYTGATAFALEYGLNTDLTPRGLGLVRPGDISAVSIMSRNMTRLDTILTRAACEVRLAANLSLTHGMDASISWTTETEDTGGFVTVPSTTLVVPAGISRLSIGAAIRLTAALSNSGHVVTIRLLKNATEILQQSLVEPGISLALGRPGLPVIAGDTLSVKVAASDPNTVGLPQISAGAYTNFHAFVAEVV